MARDDDVEVVAEVVRTTERAYCIRDSRDEVADKSIWLPKSQVELSHYMEDGKRAVFIVPGWLAREKGLE